MYARWVLTALLAWPAVAAAAILIAPPRWAKHLGFAASLIEFAISVPLWWTFVPSGGMQVVCDAPWIQVPLFGTGAPWSIRYSVGVDGISLFMVLLTTLLVPLSVLGSYSYITTRERAYYALLLVRRVLLGVRDQGADVSVPDRGPRRGGGGVDGGLGDPRRYPAQDGALRVPAVRKAVLSGCGPGAAGRDRGRGPVARRDSVRRPRRDGATRLQEADRLFVGRASRLRDAGHLGVDAAERAGRVARHDQSRHLHRRPVLPGGDDLRAAAQPTDRRLRRHRARRAPVRRDPHVRVAVVDRAAGHQRLRRRVPRAGGRLPDAPRRRGHSGHRCDPGCGLPAVGLAARDLQPARQTREREAARPHAARAGGVAAARGLHRVDRRVSGADPRPDGARRAPVHRERSAAGAPPPRAPALLPHPLGSPGPLLALP